MELAKHVSLRCPNLEFSGLMTIGMLDYTSTPENFKVIFSQMTCNSMIIFPYISVLVLELKSKIVSCQTLANCRSEVCKALGIAEEQCELSMGMSGDFELAVRINILLLMAFIVFSTTRVKFLFTHVYRPSIRPCLVTSLLFWFLFL